MLLLFLLEIEAFDFNLKSRRSTLNVNKAKDSSEDMARSKSHNRRFVIDDFEGQWGIDRSISSPEKIMDKNDKMGRFLDRNEDLQWSRNQFLLDCRSYLTIGFATSAAASLFAFPEPSNAKLYSENAANMERINNGDFSGGSVFNNSPDTERGKKRRAMTGCKVALSREEASINILKRPKMMSEKECNTMVMDGDTEFMLQALRNLDCPTCANGIGKVQ